MNNVRYIVYLHYPGLSNPDFVKQNEMVWWLINHPSLSYSAYVTKAKQLGLNFYTEPDYNRPPITRNQLDQLIKTNRSSTKRPDYKWGWDK